MPKTTFFTFVIVAALWTGIPDGQPRATANDENTGSESAVGAEVEQTLPQNETAVTDEAGAEVQTGRTEAVTSPDGEADKQAGGKSALKRLDPAQEVWLDLKRKRVIVGGQICLRKGMLEMFACPDGTKNHESVVAVNSKAHLVHAAMLAVGMKTGRPVQYDPVYRGASGQKVKIEVVWKDEEGKVQRRPAQEMIRHVRSREAMKHDWVFAGSGFWKDEETGQEYYQAEGGELICLSNFSTATLDLPVESSRDNADLLYEAFTENIPPLGTKVRLILSAAKVQE